MINKAIFIFRRLGALPYAMLMALLAGSMLNAAPSPIGTGLLSNITLGALQDTSVVNRTWPQVVNYDLNLDTWAYDVYVPPGYDGTKPYGVMVYITSDAKTGIVLQTASSDKNIIWIAPRYVGNGATSTDRYGAGLLAIYRAKELFNIDPRRVYLSGKSGGARTASALAFYHSEVVCGVAPSSGFALPRLNEVTPDYIPNTSGKSDTYFDYSDSPFLYYYIFDNALHNSIYTTAKTNKLRSYIIGRYGDYREDYFVEAFHCAYEPQGLDCFLYNGPGGHQDPTDAEMEEAINYLDRDDTFPVNANITAGTGGFSGATGLTNISQSGASAIEATSGGNTTYTLTPTLTATAAAKTASTFYWDNANGSTVRWLWEVKDATPTNQKTSFGLWFADENWGGGAPTSVTAGANPGILITITQDGSQNRMVVSARPDSGGETVFYDGYFSFVPAYSTAWTNTQTGYLTGTGSPVEIRMDLNQSRWQLSFNGIKLDGTTNSIASGTEITRDNRRQIYGYWDSATDGSSFWKHDPSTSRNNTWSPFTKSIFTAASGALSGTGSTPAPMELRYVIASDPNLPAPPQPDSTGLVATPVSIGQIDLSWDTSTGADSYNVKWAGTSGGPYKNIATDITSTNYSDKNVLAGTTNYYVVSAKNAGGESANSSEASATTPSAVAYVPFDEGTGTTASDYTDNDFDGTLVNSATWRTGVIGNALDLNGSNAHATLPTGVVEHLGDFTIHGWVYLDTISTWSRIFDFGTGTSVNMFLTPKAGGSDSVRFAITNDGAGGEQRIDGSAALSTGTWTHVAVTLAGTTGTLYVDGSAVGTNSSMNLYPGAIATTTLNYIGRSQYSDPYLDGAVDEFTIVGRAMSSSEISGLASQTVVAYLPFDESSGTSAPDESHHSNVATLNNGAGWTTGMHDNGMSLDGTDDYASLPSGPVAGLTNFTIHTWVYLDTISDWSRVFDFGTGTSTSMFLTPRAGGTGKVRFAITTGGPGGEQQINGTSPLPSGDWTHVAVTLDGSVGTLYVNGVAVGTNSNMSLTPDDLGNTTQNYIGRSQYSDPYLDGVVDDFKIIDRALSADEIADLYRQ